MTKELTIDILKIAISLIFVFLLIDFMGYAAWRLSGQHPIDGFYAGALTAKVLGPVR